MPVIDGEVDWRLDFMCDYEVQREFSSYGVSEDDGMSGNGEGRVIPKVRDACDCRGVMGDGKMANPPGRGIRKEMFASNATDSC